MILDWRDCFPRPMMEGRTAPDGSGRVLKTRNGEVADMLNKRSQFGQVVELMNLSPATLRIIVLY